MQLVGIRSDQHVMYLVFCYSVEERTEGKT